MAMNGDNEFCGGGWGDVPSNDPAQRRAGGDETGVQSTESYDESGYVFPAGRVPSADMGTNVNREGFADKYTNPDFFGSFEPNKITNANASGRAASETSNPNARTPVGF